MDTYFPTSNWLLSSRDERRLQVIESEVAPGAGAGDELYSLPGEIEFVYVLEGALEITVGEETMTLGRGRRAHVRALEAAYLAEPVRDATALRVLWTPSRTRTNHGADASQVLPE